MKTRREAERFALLCKVSFTLNFSDPYDDCFAAQIDLAAGRCPSIVRLLFRTASFHLQFHDLNSFL